jgi:hypothetical protein
MSVRLAPMFNGKVIAKIEMTRNVMNIEFFLEK